MWSYINMIKNEAKLTTQFLKWCKVYMPATFVFEAKYSKDDAIPYDSVKEHQEHALLVCKHDHLLYKIPDSGFQNPFDGLSLKGIPAFIVLFFKTDVFMIDIDDWMTMKQNDNRRSITKEQCERLFKKHSLKVGKVDTNDAAKQLKN